MSNPEVEVLPTGGRRCTKCGKIKSSFDFRFAPTGYQGLSSWCVTCIEAAKPKAKAKWLPGWVNRT